MAIDTDAKSLRYQAYLDARTHNNPYSKKEFIDRDDQIKSRGIILRNYHDFFDGLKNRLPERYKITLTIVEMGILHPGFFLPPCPIIVKYVVMVSAISLTFFCYLRPHLCIIPVGLTSSVTQLTNFLWSKK